MYNSNKFDQELAQSVLVLIEKISPGYNCTGEDKIFNEYNFFSFFFLMTTS